MCWLVPRNAYEVRIFHGLASFYNKFIRNLSQISAPMIYIIKGNRQPFRWTEAVEGKF